MVRPNILEPPPKLLLQSLLVQCMTMASPSTHCLFLSDVASTVHSTLLWQMLYVTFPPGAVLALTSNTPGLPLCFLVCFVSLSKCYLQEPTHPNTCKGSRPEHSTTHRTHRPVLGFMYSLLVVTKMVQAYMFTEMLRRVVLRGKLYVNQQII